MHRMSGRPVVRTSQDLDVWMSQRLDVWRFARLGRKLFVQKTTLKRRQWTFRFVVLHLLEKARCGQARWGHTIRKKYRKVPIKIGMSIDIAIRCVFCILSILGGAAWSPWAQAIPQFKQMRKTKPTPMLMPGQWSNFLRVWLAGPI